VFLMLWVHVPGPACAPPQLVLVLLSSREHIAAGVWQLGVCVFITAVPNTKLFAWGEEDSGGHVL
jgi:hypothetical protein